MAKQFGLTPEQFAENVRDNYQRHEVEQPPVPPLEAAAPYVIFVDIFLPIHNYLPVTARHCDVIPRASSFFNTMVLQPYDRFTPMYHLPMTHKYISSMTTDE